MQSKVKTPIAKAIENQAVSLSDIGYKASVNIDANLNLASQLMAYDSKFPSEVTQETRDALYVGFQRRANEKKGTKYFYADGNTLVPVESLDKAPKGRETIALTVDFAMAQNPYEFGKLKESNRALYEIIRETRIAFQKYASECLSALKSCANKILNEGKPKERKANKNFRESLEFLFDDAKTGLDKKVNTAKAKGDLTADPVMYRMAKEAFFNVYTKK
jgi:hypothetical protein